MAQDFSLVVISPGDRVRFKENPGLYGIIECVEVWPGDDVRYRVVYWDEATRKVESVASGEVERTGKFSSSRHIGFHSES